LLLKKVLFPFGFRQVSLQPIGLGAENGFTEFLIPIHHGVPLYSQSGFSESYKPENIGPGYSFQKKRTEIIRLDDCLSRRGITPESVAAVKIDVEGSEMAVFTGGEDFFRCFRGLLLCEFWFNQVPPPGWTWLRERGYLCRYLGKNGEWMPANTPEEMQALCQGETYGNFFLERSDLNP
jgi:FkbM family methyltransferase